VVDLKTEIPLRVCEKLGGDKAFLIMQIRSARHRMFGFIEAFVDTGSPETIFSEKEGLRFHFPYKRIRPVNTIGLGGGSVSLHPCRNLRVRVKDLNNRFHEFEIDVYFSRSVSRTQRSIAEAQGVPNILGVDFLKATGFGFVYNARERVALLVKDKSRPTN